jgi:hypothetical protein
MRAWSIAALGAIGLLAGACGSGQTTPATTTTAHSSALHARHLSISVQSEKQMRNAGNYGPWSSILLPHSCEVRGRTVSATGTYQGGFAQAIYNRFGDIVVLYVFTAPTSGFPQGITLAASSARTSPPMTSGTWRVSTSVSLIFGPPERCVVAAQPTHDWIGAP